MDPEVLSVVLGGGGVVGVIVAVHAWYKDSKNNRVMREDTALARLQEDYKRKKTEAEKGWRIVSWYRHNYAVLWAAYMRIPPEDKEYYPPSPPVDLGD